MALVVGLPVDGLPARLNGVTSAASEKHSTSMQNSVKPGTFLWLFLSLRGRVGRQAYILAGIFLLALRMYVLYRVGLAEDGSAQQENLILMLIIVVLASAWANIALSTKRLHDANLSGLWSLFALVIDLLMFFILPVFKSDPGPNRYGTRSDSPA